MAQFRGTMQGQRGEASRLGSKKSGLMVKVNGWNAGVTVEARHNEGKDHFTLYHTGGSNGGSIIYIGRIIDGVFYPAGQAEKVA